MSPRVKLRSMVPADARALACWATDPVFTARAGWSSASDVEGGERWWRERIGAPDPLQTRLAVVEADVLVGYVDLHGDGAKERELGYVIGPSSRWGAGLATAAARAAIEHGFGQMRLRRIWAEAVEANRASVRVLEKAGLRAVAPGDPETFLGESSRHRRFEVFRQEWAAAASDTGRGELSPGRRTGRS